MAKARKIRKRAKAVQNVHVVTKTMQMVASSRFRRAFDRSAAARPYTDRLTDLVAGMLDRAEPGQLTHPLLKEHPDVRREVLVVLTSNRGLCGTLNASVLQVAMDRCYQLQGAGYEVLLHVVGKRGMQYFRFRNIPTARQYTELGDLPTYDEIVRVADSLMESYLAEEVSGVEVAYMQFLAAGRQTPVIAQFLPLSNLQPPTRHVPTPGEAVPYYFLPAGQQILQELLPATFRLRMYQCFLDSSLSEQIVRIRAMQNATQNAEEMLHNLTVRYNRLRQTQITTELAEIMGGSAGRTEATGQQAAASMLREMIRRQSGKVEVEVTSAVPLSDEQEGELRRSLREALDAEPLLKVRIDVGLLGGAVIRVDDCVYDASIARRIGALIERISGKIEGGS